IRACWRQRPVFGMRLAVVVLLGGRQYEPGGVSHGRWGFAVAVDAEAPRGFEAHLEVVRRERVEVAVARHPRGSGLAAAAREKAVVCAGLDAPECKHRHLEPVA